jgi:hypothetical protein
MNIEDVLKNFIITETYYCDIGRHEGKTRVILDAYLTGEQLRTLQDVLFED